MKKIIFLFVIILLGILPNCSFAQNNSTVLGLPYEEIHSKHDVAMPYQYVREADVMWSKIIWRRIELKEKKNHILYEPTTPIGPKKSLIDVVLDGIEKKGLTAYKAKAEDAGNEFDIIMKEDEINTKMGASQEKLLVQVLEGFDTVIVNQPYYSADITSYLVKEVWFFDKQRSVLDVRIIGFCPILEYYKPLDPDHLYPQYKKVFWIYYPEARPMLANAPVFNPNSDVTSLTFDDIFQKRYFSSYIVMESNPYNRTIGKYEMGLEALLEGERVKAKIFNLEQDLWEY